VQQAPCLHDNRYIIGSGTYIAVVLYVAVVLVLVMINDDDDDDNIVKY